MQTKLGTPPRERPLALTVQAQPFAMHSQTRQAHLATLLHGEALELTHLHLHCRLAYHASRTALLWHAATGSCPPMSMQWPSGTTNISNEQRVM